ncbi:MAG: thiamine diphosphokinase [Pseudomonadota bacterium]
MSDGKLQFSKPVTLVGGGELQTDVLQQSLELAPSLVAADGAADRLKTMGHAPDAVIGDMDSIATKDKWRNGPAQFIHLAEQHTTDFEKCLYSVDAPGFVCVGFTGRRVDHSLAVFHGMLRHSDRKVLLLSANDVISLVPEAGLRIDLPVKARVSLYPLLPVRGVASEGLRWPIGGLEMAAGQQIGTSNMAVSSTVSVEFDKPGALLILDQKHVDALIIALGL